MHRDAWNELFSRPSGPNRAGWVVAPVLVVAAVLGVVFVDGGSDGASVPRPSVPEVAAPPTPSPSTSVVVPAPTGPTAMPDPPAAAPAPAPVRAAPGPEPVRAVLIAHVAPAPAPVAAPPAVPTRPSIASVDDLEKGPSKGRKLGHLKQPGQGDDDRGKHRGRRGPKR